MRAAEASHGAKKLALKEWSAYALVNCERYGGQPPREIRAEAGEPGGNRTPNPQIKSLLLCQLSYRPYELPIVM